jgi:hypothetical protein
MPAAPALEVSGSTKCCLCGGLVTGAESEVLKKGVCVDSEGFLGAIGLGSRCWVCDRAGGADAGQDWATRSRRVRRPAMLRAAGGGRWKWRDWPHLSMRCLPRSLRRS